MEIHTWQISFRHSWLDSVFINISVIYGVYNIVYCEVWGMKGVKILVFICTINLH